jgi:hypothetical protein
MSLSVNSSTRLDALQMETCPLPRLADVIIPFFRSTRPSFSLSMSGSGAKSNFLAKNSMAT